MRNSPPCLSASVVGPVRPMEEVRALLRGMRKREALFRLLAAMLWAAAVGGGLLLAFSAADFFLCLQAHVRAVLLRAFEAALGASGVYLVLAPVLTRKRTMRMAWEVERARPEFRNSLITAIEGGGSAVGDAQVLGAVEKRAHWLLERTDPDDVVSIRPLLRGAQAAGGVLLAWMLAALLLGGPLIVSVKRTLFPSAPIRPPTKTRIVDPSPGYACAGLGQEVEFRCRTEGPAESVKVLVIYDRKHWRTLEMKRDKTGVWRAKLSCLRGHASYYFQAGSVKTDLMTLTAARPPSVEDVRVCATLPGGEDVEFASAQSVRVLEGSEVVVEAKASEPVLVTPEGAEAWLEYDDGRRQRMEADGCALKARFRADADRRYRFFFRSEKGGQGRPSCWRQVLVAKARGRGKGGATGAKSAVSGTKSGGGSGSPGGGGGLVIDTTSPIEQMGERAPTRTEGFGMGRRFRAKERPSTAREDSLPGERGAISAPPERALDAAVALPPKELERLAKEAQLRAAPEYRELVAAYYRTLAREGRAAVAAPGPTPSPSSSPGAP